MMLDISIRIRKQDKCPHCGGAINGEAVDDISTGGRRYHKLLEKIGYTDADYGQYKTLSKEQVEIAAKEFDLQGEARCAEPLALAALNGSIVEFEADW